jgi:hypothetical protein
MAEPIRFNFQGKIFSILSTNAGHFIAMRGFLKVVILPSCAFGVCTVMVANRPRAKMMWVNGRFKRKGLPHYRVSSTLPLSFPFPVQAAEPVPVPSMTAPLSQDPPPQRGNPIEPKQPTSPVDDSVGTTNCPQFDLEWDLDCDWDLEI